MQQVPGGVPAFDPFIRYNEFGDLSVKFTVILRGRTFVGQYAIRHEFIKRLARTLRARGDHDSVPDPHRHRSKRGCAGMMPGGHPSNPAISRFLQVVCATVIE
jgi:hypothetical protein